MMEKCIQDIDSVINDAKQSKDHLQPVVEESEHPYQIGSMNDGYVGIPGTYY